MNLKKSKITLLLGASLFLTVPLVSTFADQQHHEMHDMNMGEALQNIKDELRGYVDGVKSDDTQKMQQHVDALLKLSTMPTMNHADMDHSKMDNSEMQMAHADMTDETMATMDHSKMDHSEMPMDHSDMTSEMMATMDHSKMDHSEMQMAHADMTDETMDHANMKHNISSMSDMPGMSAEQHQHMMYMQEMGQFNVLFMSLDKAKDKSEISAILVKVKEQIKNSHF